MRIFVTLFSLLVVSSHAAFSPRPAFSRSTITTTTTTSSSATTRTVDDHGETPSRRSFLATSAAIAIGTNLIMPQEPAEAIGPVKVELINPTYTAGPCPKDRPIPGEKAMKGMRGLCVEVEVDLAENAPKDLEKVGVYGFVTNADTGDSVLANNPDLSTDAGQFAIIETVTTKDKKLKFDFVAAIPAEIDVSKFENGIGNLKFASLRIISFPGGQQYGTINPCEMNEFSDECDVWEKDNGPYKKAEYMIKSNKRTKGS